MNDHKRTIFDLIIKGKNNNIYSVHHCEKTIFNLNCINKEISKYLKQMIHFEDVLDLAEAF